MRLAQKEKNRKIEGLFFLAEFASVHLFFFFRKKEEER